MKRLLLTVLVICLFLVAPVAADESPEFPSTNMSVVNNGNFTTPIADPSLNSSVNNDNYSTFKDIAKYTAQTEGELLAGTIGNVIVKKIALDVAKKNVHGLILEALYSDVSYAGDAFDLIPAADKIYVNAINAAADAPPLVVLAGGIIATTVLVGSVSLVVYSVATEDPKIFEGFEQTYNWYDYP